MTGAQIFEENGRKDFKDIDVMRTARGFDSCLPCRVHMYLGKGKTLEKRHSPENRLGHFAFTPRGGLRSASSL